MRTKHDEELRDVLRNYFYLGGFKTVWFTFRLMSGDLQTSTAEIIKPGKLTAEDLAAHC